MAINLTQARKSTYEPERDFILDLVYVNRRSSW